MPRLMSHEELLAARESEPAHGKTPRQVPVSPPPQVQALMARAAPVARASREIAPTVAKVQPLVLRETTKRLALSNRRRMTRVLVGYRPRRLDRRLGCGRPAHRRGSRTSRASPSDLDPPRAPRASGPRHISAALADVGYESELPRCADCGAASDGNLWSYQRQRHLCFTCVAGTRAERERLNPPWDGERRPSTWGPLDEFLKGLRRHASDAYRLVAGEGGDPDRWLARCPLHVDVGFTLVVTDRGDDREPGLWCRAGCPAWAIGYALVDDLEREQAAAAVARAIVYGQAYGKRRRAA
jgi:hypothetical protein